MSLLSKSHDNYCTFLLLKGHGETENANFYTAAVHCAYYSCYQKLLYILQVYYEDRYDAVNVSGSGSHKQMIGEFVSCMYYSFKEHKQEITQLNRFLTDLKTFRHKSDYKEDLISSGDIERVHSRLEDIRRIVKKTTKL